MEIKDLAGFSEPTKTLIERCSDALGSIAHPYQIVRVAKAESKAEVIKARGQIEIDKIKAQGVIEVLEVEERALARLVHEEGKKQQNIEDVIAKALPEVKEDAKPEDIEEDWLSNFFDKCRLVSDEEMQLLWGKVLAGEANAPKTYSKRTVNFLQSLSKEEATKFQLLCRFSINPNDALPTVYDLRDDIYIRSGLRFQDLQNLQGIGLIVQSGALSYDLTDLPEQVVVSYFSTQFLVKFPQNTQNQFKIGQVLVTDLGKEVAKLCQVTSIEGFADYLVKKWIEFGYEVTSLTDE